LPFTSAVRSIAVIGDAAGEHAKFTGGGSAEVKPSRRRLPLQAIIERAGRQVKVTYAQGTRGTAPLPAVSADVLRTATGSTGLDVMFYPSDDSSGARAAARIDPGIDKDWREEPPVPGLPRRWSARWNGTLLPATSGSYRFSLAGTGEARLYCDDRLVATLSDE